MRGKYQFTREEQDQFALTSLSRALAANNDGTFAWEIAPVTVTGRKGDVVIDKDEQPAKALPDKIPLLKPAFRKDGTVTAANSSSISDGAAALVLMRRSDAEKRGLHAARGDRRARDACAGARVVLDGAGRRHREALQQDRLDDARRRPLRDQRGVRRRHDGGDEGTRACRTTRSTCTAAPARSGIRSARQARASSSRCIGALRKHGGKRGVAALCIGGGEATAMAIELV